LRTRERSGRSGQHVTVDVPYRTTARRARRARRDRVVERTARGDLSPSSSQSSTPTQARRRDADTDAGWLPADGRTAAADRASRGDENVRHDHLFRILLGPPQATIRRSRARWRTSRTSRAVSPRGRTVVRAAGGSTEIHVGFHRRGRVPSAGERGSERASGVWPQSRDILWCGRAAGRRVQFDLRCELQEPPGAHV